jgi:hypothetical protein
VKRSLRPSGTSVSDLPPPQVFYPQVAAVVRNVSTSFSRHYSATKGLMALSPTGSARESIEEFSDEMSSHSGSPHPHVSTHSDTSPSMVGQSDAGPPDQSSPASFNMSIQSSDGLRKGMLRGKSKASRTQAVIVVGPPGYVHSSVLCQAPEMFVVLARVRWCWPIKQSGAVSYHMSLRAIPNLNRLQGHGLWGQAKFQGADSAPFSALVGICTQFRILS